jgi:hypothetical protein
VSAESHSVLRQLSPVAHDAPSLDQPGRSGRPVRQVSGPRRDLGVRRQESVSVRGSGPPSDWNGRRKFFPSWRCVVLDVALVALTIAVFGVLVLILKGLERL